MKTLVIIALYFVVGTQSADWNHDQIGVDWRTTPIGQCGEANNQSPIDIVTATATAETFPSFSFSSDYWDKITGFWKNTKHGIQFDVTDTKTRTVTGGPFGTATADAYKLLQFHFHWGSTNNKGSEHTVDGVAHMAEVHFVHYKAAYGDAASAIAAPAGDGLAVLGFFVKFNETKIPSSSKMWPRMIKKVLNYNTRKTAPTSTVNIRDVIQTSLGDMGKLDQFYTYPGSLTTPNCNPIVTWVNMMHPINLPATILQLFRKVKDNRNVATVNNYRETIAVGTRTVRKSTT